MSAARDAVIRSVVAEHEFQSTATSRNGFNHHRAGCSCDPDLTFDWYLRETQHKEHLYAAIYEAGREAGR